MPWNRRTPALLLALVCASSVATGCGRGARLPDVSGFLVDVVIRAALEGGAPADGPLLLDRASFTRLGAVVRGEAFTDEQVLAQLGRPAVLIDRRDVLACPERRPCHVVDDGVYIEVWEAEQRGEAVELVATRVSNVQGLHRMTRSATHRMILARAGAGWRLSRLERLPD